MMEVLRRQASWYPIAYGNKGAAAAIQSALGALAHGQMTVSEKGKPPKVLKVPQLNRYFIILEPEGQPRQFVPVLSVNGKGDGSVLSAGKPYPEESVTRALRSLLPKQIGPEPF